MTINFSIQAPFFKQLWTFQGKRFKLPNWKPYSNSNRQQNPWNSFNTGGSESSHAVSHQSLGMFYPIFYYRNATQMKISAFRAASGLKFWLQVGLGAPIATPWAEVRKSGSGKSGFSGIFFCFFSLLWTSWDLRVTPRMFPYHLIRIRTGKSGFSKIRIFRFFLTF